MLFVVTGCPHNDYTVRLRPQGDQIERTLVFYHAESGDIATNELAAITALYPAGSLTRTGTHYTVRSEFGGQLPADVGGAGTYTQDSNTLGSAGLYFERFRGTDDLAGLTEKRFQAADRLTDLLLGWTWQEMWRDPDYPKLRRFLDADFRRDLKNLGTYCWEGQLAGNFDTNGTSEFILRFGQYLIERGYFSIGELPGLYRDLNAGNDAALQHRIQRLAARRLGVPDRQPIPASIAFLADDKSFGRYLATTDLYRAKLVKWRHDVKLDPKTRQPDPEEVAQDLFGELLDYNLFGGSDHLTVQLSLPAPPDRSNGVWDSTNRQVVWRTDIEERTTAAHLPYACYANWTSADETFQIAHFGKVALTGDALNQYCLWRASLDAGQGGEWDAFLAGLQPGAGLLKQIDAFRFPGETNTPPPSLSNCPRELFKAALK